MPTSISLVICQLLFCHRYDDINLEFSHLWFCFPDSLLFLMDSRPTKFPVNDPGIQSGHETQFVFSEADVRDSETDYASRRALCEYTLFIPFLH